MIFVEHLPIAYKHISKIYCKWVIRISAFKMQSSTKKSNELWAIDSNRKCILKRCVALSFNRAAYPFTGTLHTHTRTKTIQCTLSYGPLIGLSTGMKLSEQNLWPHLFIYAASCILSVYGVKMRKQSMFCAIEVDSPVSASAHMYAKWFAI